jgi:hypothetical protein
VLPEINAGANNLFATSMASSPDNGRDKGVVEPIVDEGRMEETVVDGDVREVSVTRGVVDLGTQLLSTRDKIRSPNTEIRSTNSEILNKFQAPNSKSQTTTKNQENDKISLNLT